METTEILVWLHVGRVANTVNVESCIISQNNNAFQRICCDRYVLVIQ